MSDVYGGCKDFIEEPVGLYFKLQQILGAYL